MGKKLKKKKSKSKRTRHHIIPTSRGGSDFKNIVYIDRYRHDLYHRLFDNKVPHEILDYLKDNHWNGKKLSGEKLRIYNLLFNDMTPNEIINYLIKTFWGNQKSWLNMVPVEQWLAENY